MELKVWCDGIQRVVCGATAATTCQDIVFALAHATGQTGRFILIEKWRNNERVLAPTDRPLTSLAKWGEYSSDVTFVLKKSGEVDSSNDNKISSISKKSDTDLLLKRKDVNHFNNQENNEKHISKSSKIKSMSSIDTSQSHSNTLPSKHKEPFVRSLSFYKSNQLESSQHRENANISSNGVGKLIDKFNSTSGGESLYGTLPNNRHRPRQPPPYKEAITKSTLVNIINTTTSPNNGSTYGYLGGFSNKTNHSSSQQSSPFASTTPHSNRTGPFNETLRKENATLKSNHNQQSPLHQETIYLIDTQQKTIKNQERNINNIEHEIDLVQKKLSENKYIVKRYQDEMELLNQLWVEQEMLIQKLESENMEQELDQLIVEGEKYEGEMKEIKSKLAECESEVMKCREEISNLMGKIEEQATINPFSVDTSCDESTLLERIEASIKDKSQELQSQKSDIETLNESIEQMDKTIEGKNSLIDQLVVEIKEANVEGLSFQSAASSGLVVEERECETAHDLTMVRSPTNRKIPVSPHELANTVPTKKNPDGIWV